MRRDKLRVSPTGYTFDMFRHECKKQGSKAMRNADCDTFVLMSVRDLGLP